MFKAAAQGGAVPLVIIGVIASGVAAYFYVRVIVSMFFTEPTDDTPQVVAPGILSKIAIAVCAAITVVLGHLPAAAARPGRPRRPVAALDPVSPEIFCQFWI